MKIATLCSLLAIFGYTLAISTRQPLESLYNVKDWGAKGDGVNDDAPAINQALGDIQGYGGTAYFPAGLFRCVGDINLREEVALLGCGRASRLRMEQGSVRARSEPNKSQSEFTIENLNIYRSHMGDAGPALSFEGQSPYGVGRVYLRNVVIEGSNGAGIFVSRMWIAQWENVRIKHCATGLATAQGDNVCNHLGWHGGSVESCDIGIHSHDLGTSGFVQASFRDLVFQHNAQAFKLSWDQSVTIDGCYFEANAADVLIGAEARSKGVRVLNSRFVGSSREHAVIVYGARNFLVSGCEFIGYSGSPVLVSAVRSAISGRVSNCGTDGGPTSIVSMPGSGSIDVRIE